MAISIYSNSGNINYGIKHFTLDTIKDLEKISINYTPGSTIYISESSETYILNNSHKWILFNNNNNNNNNNEETDIDIRIFNGGAPEGEW